MNASDSKFFMKMVEAAESEDTITLTITNDNKEIEVYRAKWEREEPEQPQWWKFGRSSRKWSATSYGGVLVDEMWVIVYSTTADRDAKRDALLEAARKAGKP